MAFSKTGYWLPYKREDRDEKATLVDWYVGMAAETQPQAITMENVYEPGTPELRECLSMNEGVPEEGNRTPGRS